MNPAADIHCHSRPCEYPQVTGPSRVLQSGQQLLDAHNMETVISLTALLAGIGSGLLHLETREHVRSGGQVWEERLHLAVSVLAAVRGDVVLVVFTAPLSIYFLAR